MECAAKRSGTRCVGPPVRRCARCQAVAYCSLSHQNLHWIDHKKECERLEEQLRKADILNEFPFTFCAEATTQICGKRGSRCSFLGRRGLHQIGMWSYECPCWVADVPDNLPALIKSWNLSSMFAPCIDPVSPLSKQLSCWKEYYEWRSIPSDSPVSLLLQWPLTIYNAVQLHADRILSCEADKGIINIHYLGPDKELFQLAAFGELLALLPQWHVHIEFVGPAVPEHSCILPFFTKVVKDPLLEAVADILLLASEFECHLPKVLLKSQGTNCSFELFGLQFGRDGERINLDTFACCDDRDCKCKMPNESRGSTVTLRLLKGFYHDRFKDTMKDCFPNLIVAPNAGIAAYTSWKETIELIHLLNIPVVFTDFCEEAAHLAAACLTNVTGCELALPIELNPFRQPLAVEDSVLHLPCYSNCYTFGI